MTRLALPAAAPPGSPVSGVPPWPLQGIHPFTAKCRGREGASEEFAGSEPVVLGGVRDQPGTVSPARSHSPLGSWGLCFLLLTMNPCSPAASGVYSADKANSSVKLRASITEGDARARGKLSAGRVGWEWGPCFGGSESSPTRERVLEDVASRCGCPTGRWASGVRCASVGIRWSCLNVSTCVGGWGGRPA